MIKKFTLVVICFLFISGCCSEGIDIKVKKSMALNLNKYHLATIVVKDFEYMSKDEKNIRDISSNNSYLYILSQLSSFLREKGLEVTYGDKDPIDLKVECFFRRSLGCVHVGRHFNTECMHESFVNLKFVDMRTKEIIGEVECTRPSFKRIPYTFIKLMINELISREGFENGEQRPIKK